MTNSFRNSFGSFAALLAILLLGGLLLPAAAQSVITGDIVGTVSDESNAVVPDVTVTLTSVDTSASNTTRTSALGFYRFNLIKPGNYKILVSHPGFRSVQAPVAVAIGQVVTANLQLQVGQTSETVEVSGIAPMLQTENANLSTSYDPSQLSALPIAGGDTTSFAYSAPGIVLNSGAGYGNFSAYGLVQHGQSVHHQRQRQHGSLHEPEQLRSSELESGVERVTGSCGRKQRLHSTVWASGRRANGCVDEVRWQSIPRQCPVLVEWKSPQRQ